MSDINEHSWTSITSMMFLHLKVPPVSSKHWAADCQLWLDALNKEGVKSVKMAHAAHRPDLCFSHHCCLNIICAHKQTRTCAGTTELTKTEKCIHTHTDAPSPYMWGKPRVGAAGVCRTEISNGSARRLSWRGIPRIPPWLSTVSPQRKLLPFSHTLLKLVWIKPSTFSDGPENKQRETQQLLDVCENNTVGCSE